MTFAILALIVLTAALFATAESHERVVALNTLLLGGLTCGLALPIAIVTATIMLRTGLVPRLLGLAMVCLTFTPTFMHVSAWDSAFGKLGWLTNLSGSGNELQRWFSAVWIHTSAAIPATALFIWYSLFRCGKNYEDQALLDAGRGTVFWRITLPRLLPVIAFCSLWIFVGCSREIAVTDIYRIGTFSEQIYLGYALGDFNNANGLTLLPVNEFSTIVLMFIAVVSGALAWTLLGFLSQIKNNDEASARGQVRATGRQAAIGLLMIAIFYLIPIANLIVRGSKKVEMVDGQPVASFSVRNLWMVCSDVPSTFAQEFAWSATVAGLSAIVCMTLAILLVWFAQESKRMRYFVILIFSVSLGAAGAADWIDDFEFERNG